MSADWEDGMEPLGETVEFPDPQINPGFKAFVSADRFPELAFDSDISDFEGEMAIEILSGGFGCSAQARIFINGKASDRHGGYYRTEPNERVTPRLCQPVRVRGYVDRSPSWEEARAGVRPQVFEIIVEQVL